MEVRPQQLKYRAVPVRGRIGAADRDSLCRICFARGYCRFGMLPKKGGA